MASIPRILVVEAYGGLSDVVRAGMVMLNREHILVQVPSIQAAFDEIMQSNLTMIVTAYRFGNDERTGIDLAERAIREQAGTPIVIVANAEDPAPDPLALTGKPFYFLSYPPGEHFVRALRIGLDGEEAVQARESSQRGNDLDIGPIPNINIEAAQKHLYKTMIESGSIAAMICDRMGHILTEQGSIGYVDKTMLAATFAPHFPQAIKIAPQIGGTGWSMKYYDGERYDLFALALGYHHFVVFVFDGSNRAAISEMTRYRRQGIEELIGYIGDDAWTYTESVVVTETDLVAQDVPQEPVMAKRRTTALSLDEVFAEAPQAEETPFDEPFLEPVSDLDLDVLFGDGLDGANDLFNDDGSLDHDGIFDLSYGESVSFDEAQDMGLLGE